jgi:hypothetical protein
MAGDEAPLAAWSEIVLANRDGIPLAQAPPPSPDVFRLAHGLEHEVTRRVEQTRHADLEV